VIGGGDGAYLPGFETVWSRRYKINAARLSSGDPAQAAEVVRERSQIEAERGVSAGEQRMLARARRMLD
jgi:CarD family transcriptional regulator